MAGSNNTGLSASDIIPLFAAASLLLACVAIILALGGVFAFLNVRSTSKRTAEKVARKTAEIVSERAAISYLQAQLPELTEEYRELARNSANAELAEGIADTEAKDQR